MLENSALCSRLLFAFALAGAAVMSFIMCSDAARASPITTQVEAKHGIVRRLYIPYGQHQPLSAGLLSTEPGFRTGADSKSETNQNFREASSIRGYQLNSLRFTEGSFRYNHNSPDNRRTEVWPSSSLFSSHHQHGGQRFGTWQPRVNNHPGTGNLYNSYPVILRKSALKEAAGPFHQSSSPSQVWEPTVAQKSYSNENVPTNDSPKVAEDKTAWQFSASSLFPSQTGRHWHTSPPTPRGHYSGYKETNEGARSTSSGIQLRKVLSFASHTAPTAPLVSNSLDASGINSTFSPEKLTSSISEFPKGFHSVSSSETPRRSKVKSYLFKDSQTSFGVRAIVNTVAGDGHSALSIKPHQQRPSDTQVYSRFPPHFKHSQQSQRIDPSKEVQHLSDNAHPLYHNANVARYGAQTGSFTKYQHPTAETLAQIAGHPAPGTGDTKGSFVPARRADFQSSYNSGSEKSVASSPVNATSRGTIKSTSGFRGFRHPVWRAAKDSPIISSNDKATSQGNNFDKGEFKIPNTYPSLSAKYSFGQREASTPTTTPTKPDRTPTDHPSPSPGTLHTVQTTTTPRPSPPGFKEAWSLPPGDDASMDSNPDRRQVRIYRRIYRLKGFGTRPLEGANTLVGEPGESARVQQGFEGFQHRSSLTWQPKSSRIQRYWHNKTGETEPGSSHVPSSVSRHGLSSEATKPAESSQPDTRFTPDTYKRSRKIYHFLGFHPVQNRTGDAINKTHWTYREQNLTTASENHRSAGDLKVKSSPKTPNKPVAMMASLLRTSTSSTVRGKRVKGKPTSGRKLEESTSLTTDNVAIVRLPKWYARPKAVTYADILGSASFSSVRATTQTPIAPADKGYFPNTAVTTKQKAAEAHWSLNNTSRGPEAPAEDEGGDFSSVELDVKGEELDRKTSDLVLDDEGSGSGRFSTSDGLSTDTTRGQGHREYLLDLDYLRISTGNVSFKSIKLSQSDK